MKRLTLFVIFGALVWTGICGGTDLPSLERGKELFTSKQLGTTGMSCATCHPGGKKLENASSSGDDELANTINSCISGPLKGNKLDPASNDMKSLVLYIKSFAVSGK